MTKKQSKGTLHLAIIVVILLLLISCTSSSKALPVGSSQIETAMREIAGDKLEITSFIPGGMCPGHYDVKPADVEALANSKLFVMHNWQQKHKSITSLIEAANNPDLDVRTIDIIDAPMLPSYQIEMGEEVLKILTEVYPEHSSFFEANAAERETRIAAKEAELENRINTTNIEGVPVLCSEMQADFIKWLGFDIVATYGRPEALSVAEVDQLIQSGIEGDVVLVIDNLQSGGIAHSESLAQDIGAKQVVISNFQGGFEDTETWEKAVDRNIDLLLEALEHMSDI